MILNHECPLCKVIHEKECTPEPDRLCYPCELKVHTLGKLTTVLSDIRCIKRRHEKEIKSTLTDSYNLGEAELGIWNCEQSPIKQCVYDIDKDPAMDDCIFCHHPDERK